MAVQSVILKERMSVSPRCELRCTPSEIFVNHDGGDDHAWWAFATDAGGKVTFTKRDSAPVPATVYKTLVVDALYGAFQLLSGPYLAVVSKSRRVARGPYHAPIFQVEDMKWLPIRKLAARSSSTGDATVALSPEEREEEEIYLQLLREISETSSFFYAGGGYDLTNCLQRNDYHAWKAGAAGGSGDAAGAEATRSRSGSVSRMAGAGASSVTPSGSVASSATTDGSHGRHASHHRFDTDACLAAERPAPPVGAVVSRDAGAAAAVDPSHCDERFFWNRRALNAVVAAGPRARGFVTPIMNGFVEATHCPVADSEVGLLLISRRACTRQGTRFNMRGADAEGNVANYAESEQITTLEDGRLSSFVQVRGSIPVLWEQPVSLKYTPRVLLKGSEAANHAVFGRHMRCQLTRYGGVTAVNLIDKKKDQQRLGEAYEREVAAFGRPELRYVWFDFHAECKNMQWQNLRRLVDLVAKDFASYGYYAKDPRGAVLAVQAGVLRTNCMDNLDRTNVVQSLFARRAALLAVPGAWEATLASGCSVLTSPFPAFEAAFNNVWADNADAVSMLYSGTGALKTDFTRTGKRTMRGAIADGVNSIKRYVLNNLSDGRTQDAWDLFLGRYVPLRHHVAEARPGGQAEVAVTGSSVAASHTPAALRKDSKVKHVSPLKAHLAGMTPAGFLTGGLLLFVGIATTVALSSHALLKGPTNAQRLLWGAGAAALLLGGFAYVALSKGSSFGRSLVSTPKFIREHLSSASLTSLASTSASSHSGAGASAFHLPQADDAAAAAGATGTAAGAAGPPSARVKTA